MGHVFLFLLYALDYLVENWVLDNYNTVILESKASSFPRNCSFYFVCACSCVYVCLLKAGVVYSLRLAQIIFSKTVLCPVPSLKSLSFYLMFS